MWLDSTVDMNNSSESTVKTNAFAFQQFDLEQVCDALQCWDPSTAALVQPQHEAMGTHCMKFLLLFNCAHLPNHSVIKSHLHSICNGSVNGRQPTWAPAREKKHAW